MISTDAITWALTEYRKTVPGEGLTRAQLFQLYLDYYEGRHQLTFATEKFMTTFGATFQAMAENLCPIVVDTLADRLQTQGFTSRNKADAARVESACQEILRRNRMDRRWGEIRRDIGIYGENFVIVWPDKDEPQWAVIHPNAPGSIVVKYDPDKVGLIVQAAKAWIVGTGADARCRLNLYFPDRIEKYITSARADAIPDKADKFVRFQAFSDPNGVFPESWPLPNPYGRVPVFAYVNNGGIGQAGASELRDIIKLQNALNKSLCDMLVAMEYEAFAQRYVSGLEVEKDKDGNLIAPFKAGIDRFLFTEQPDAKFGEFSRADLSNFIEVQNSLRAAIARVAGFPLHYFMIGSETPPSGTSLIVASARFTSKVEDRQIAYGATDEDVMRFCLKIYGIDDVDVEEQWKDTSPQPDEGEVWEAAIKQKQVVGLRQTLSERDYSPEQIETIKSDLLQDEWGDSAPDRNAATSDTTTIEPENAIEVAPDGEPIAGVVTDQTLNGAQISSALDVIAQLRIGEITVIVAVEFLVSLGFPRDKAEKMANQTPRAQPADVAPPTAPNPDELFPIPNE